MEKQLGPKGAPQNRTFAEFFAGIGLMRMGLERAGWRVLFANDIDEQKQKMYRGHFGGSAEFCLGDIHRLNAGDLPSVDLATASFPCNDLSLAGSRRGLAGKHSSAFWGFIDLLTQWKERRPPLVLVENVPGFLTARRGADFHDALIALNHLGYAVDAFMIDAARFVPQSRRRLFVVGARDVSSKAIMTPSFQSECRPRPLIEFIEGNQSIRWRLRQLPPLPELRTRLEDILEDAPPDSELWWSRARSDYLLNQMSSKHRAEAETMMQDGNVRYGTIFRRVRQGKSMAELRTDGIAGCLRTPRGGSGRQILFAAGKGQFAVRLLTPRECARLMGADDFVITTKLCHALFGFGDAVCVPVIEWIARHYLNLVLEIRL